VWGMGRKCSVFSSWHRQQTQFPKHFIRSVRA
jgi:hypothetical protein